MIAKVCETGVAACQMVLPGCDAVIVHCPGCTSETVLPDIVQSPAASKETGRPEDAVPYTGKSGVPKTTSGSGWNVIVCVFCGSSVSALFSAAKLLSNPPAISN